MAVRVKNVPPGLEPGIYKVAMTRVKNRRNFVELEAQLLLETVRARLAISNPTYEGASGSTA